MGTGLEDWTGLDMDWRERERLERDYSGNSTATHQPLKDYTSAPKCQIFDVIGCRFVGDHSLFFLIVGLGRLLGVPAQSHIFSRR